MALSLLIQPCKGGSTNENLLDKGALALDVCRDGAYAVKSPPFGKCSGFRPCERGNYCQNEKRFLCPPGTFGNITGLRNSTCSGRCEAGYYCPAGSVSARENMCHTQLGTVMPPAVGVPAVHTVPFNATTSALGSVYCPEGSGAPFPVPAGYYSVTEDGSDDDFTIGKLSLRAAIVKCPKGWYCPGPGSGLRLHCPGGTYGETEGLSSSECTAKCPAGYYCPSGSADFNSRPCGTSPEWYCPKGSERRLPTEQGYYATGMIVPRVDNLAASPAALTAGYSASAICPLGSFCLGGRRIPCPSGRYGGSREMIDPLCTGPCMEGWYCPAGSSTNRAHACGTNAAVYCPASSGNPRSVSPGHYTFSQFADSTTANNAPGVGEQHLSMRHTNQTLCEAGYYCLMNGQRYACPSGRYGATPGMMSTKCSGPCDAGYYCPPGSISPKQNKCGGANFFCPEGSDAPRPVTTGYYSVFGAGSFGDYNGPEDVRAYERKCEPGFFCVNGQKYLCRAGHYGSAWLATSSYCNGPCDEGHYCPEGSISPTEIKCGSPSRYCPRNSSKPMEVEKGYYATGGLDDARRTNQTLTPIGLYSISGLIYICPAGTYGATEGLSATSCSGPCNQPGWYCPAGSITPFQKACGSDNVYCPATTVAPLVVHDGYYTSDYEYEPCPPGSWRPNVTHWIDANVPGLSGVVTLAESPHCQLCPDGQYKTKTGDGKWLCKQCPAFATSNADRSICICNDVVASGYFMHFNIVTGVCEKVSESQRLVLTDEGWEVNSAYTRYQEHECEPGHYCIMGRRYRCPVGRYGALRRETRSDCQGPCASGYYCQRSSISPYSQPCGAANHICPEGSATYQLVPAGFYSVEDDVEVKRVVMEPCPLGMYCPGDGRRYKCPAGRYTDERQTSDPQCKDVCQRGYYCEPGSPSKTQFPCGNAKVYCPRGSSQPTPVTKGFYSGFSGADAFAQALWDKGNTTMSVELLCEPGYYCIDGRKFPCPPGTFGWRYGSYNPECGGKCAAGYYCPSYLAPQPDAPAHTEWPRAPHTTATPYRCGGVSFLCPVGSFYPVLVGGGNYTIGGDKTNTTRTGQEICQAGTYCSDGIVNLCPKGRFGSSPGQSVPTCTDWCPPSHYCIAGTSKPVKCPEGYYAACAAWACSACPGTRKTPLQCQDSRECCFRGA